MGKVDMGVLRAQYQTDIKGGAKVTEAQANELAKGAESAEGREYLEQRLETDSFDPKARTVLEKAISKNETKAELAIDKATGLGPSGIVGTSAGKVGNIDITFKRELGSQGGFDSKEQARAAAVLNGKPAALVQDKTGRWHAGELSVDPKSLSGSFTANGSATLVKQPVQAEIDAAQDAFAKSGEPEDYRKLVVASLGVDDKDVVLAKPDKNGELTFEPGKINVTLRELNGGGAGGLTGYVKSSGSKMTVPMPTDRTDPGPPTTVIGRGGTNTKKLQEAYLHEATHHANEQRVEDLVGQWQRDPTASKQPFATWLKAQHNTKKISDVDYELADQATNSPAGATSKTATEALAYTKEFTNTYGNGIATNPAGSKPDLDFTFLALFGVAKNEPPDEVKKEVGKELRQMFDGLPPDKQKEFREYTAAKFGSSWLKNYLPT